MNGLKITMKDVRAARMCSRGAREFCRRHQLSYEALRHEGLSVEDVERTGDAMAQKVVEVARGRKQ